MLYVAFLPARVAVYQNIIMIELINYYCNLPRVPSCNLHYQLPNFYHFKLLALSISFFLEHCEQRLANLLEETLLDFANPLSFVALTLTMPFKTFPHSGHFCLLGFLFL